MIFDDMLYSVQTLQIHRSYIYGKYFQYYHDYNDQLLTLSRYALDLAKRNIWLEDVDPDEHTRPIVIDSTLILCWLIK